MNDLEKTNPTNWKISALLSVIILVVAGALVAVTFMTEPTAERGGATKKTPMLVETVTVNRGTFRPLIKATGTVTASQDIVLQPQVAGRVTSIHPEFTPGGFIKKGESIVRIDPTDYRTALAQRKSELQQAQASLIEEQGRQKIAAAEYKFLDRELAPADQSRMLREPNIAAAREQVKAAQASVKQAQTEIDRTNVRAPFSAHVLRRDVNVGSQVTTNEDLGRLVGFDEYWIEVEIPPKKLRFIHIPKSKDDLGSMVQVRNQTAWGKDVSRSGTLSKLVGALDQNARLAKVIVSIPDPLAREEENKDQPTLMIGEFVEVSIEGDELKDVVRLPREFVRKDETVWTMVDGKLKVNKVTIVLQDSQFAYISDLPEDNAKVVTTNLSTVVDGAPLRTEGAVDPEVAP